MERRKVFNLEERDQSQYLEYRTVIIFASFGRYRGCRTERKRLRQRLKAALDAGEMEDLQWYRAALFRKSGLTVSDVYFAQTGQPTTIILTMIPSTVYRWSSFTA